MSNRERAAILLQGIPDNKMSFVINLLENLQGYAGEAIEPDDWDREMLSRAEKENDGTTVTLEQMAEELGIEI